MQTKREADERRQWTAPVVLPLSEVRPGRGDCAAGSGDVTGACNNGNNAFGVGGCTNGITAASGCTVGTGGV